MEARRMPAWILWLSPVVVMPVLAVVWTSWATRPRGPVQAITTVQEYDAFRRAMAAPVPAPRAARSRTRTSR